VAYDFQIRQGLETTVTITELPRDIPFANKVHVYLFDGDESHSIGSANGVDAGTPLHIDVDFGKVDPGVYEVEVAEENGTIIYPTGLPEKVRVLNTRSND
jgi:hypothetical protein